MNEEKSNQYRLNRTVGPILWASGLWLFLHSGLSRRRKALWIIVLVAVGAAIGFVLPFHIICTKFVLILVILPVAAVVDLWLARSDRRYFYWLRACAFEVGTVFATAAIVRYILDLLNIRALI